MARTEMSGGSESSSDAAADLSLPHCPSSGLHIEVPRTEQTLEEDAAIPSGPNLPLEVHWMASGNVACVVSSSPSMQLSEVKEQVLQQANVPVSEQRLFAKGKELESEEGVHEREAPALMLVRSPSDPLVTNLGHFRCNPPFTKLSRCSFDMVDKIHSGINGGIFKYRWRHSQDAGPVAVKKLRKATLDEVQGAETNDRNAHLHPSRKVAPLEDPLSEIGVLSYLSKQHDLPLYLLRLFSVFEEKQFTWIVMEFCDGGELFKIASGPSCASQMQVQRYTWEMLQGVQYMHRHRIAHRDLSLENILLKDGTVRVMDFGMAVCSHSSSGTPLRYFRPAGKDSYRAPECNVPSRAEVKVTAPSASAPGDIVIVPVETEFLCEIRLPVHAVACSPCTGEVWGFAATPADVFSLGLCIFKLLFQGTPWEIAKLSDQSFARVYRSQISGSETLLDTKRSASIGSAASSLLTDMLQVDPSIRPSVTACLSCPWFATFAGQSVQTHV
jgi:serine/threonine protein kinase